MPPLRGQFRFGSAILLFTLWHRFGSLSKPPWPLFSSGVSTIRRPLLFSHGTMWMTTSSRAARTSSTKVRSSKIGMSVSTEASESSFTKYSPISVEISSLPCSPNMNTTRSLPSVGRFRGIGRALSLFSLQSSKLFSLSHSSTTWSDPMLLTACRVSADKPPRSYTTRSISVL